MFLTGSFWNLSLTSSKDPMMERHLRYVNRFNIIYQLNTCIFLQNPDDQWVYDPEVVPEGWLIKKYTFNSSYSKKVNIEVGIKECFTGRRLKKCSTT